MTAARSRGRTRRPRASRREWITFVVILFLFGAGWRWITHVQITPTWLIAALAFIAGVLVTLFCRQWIRRVMRAAGVEWTRGQR